MTGLEGAWTVSRRQEQKPETRFKVTCSFLSPDDKGSMDGMLCVNYRGEQPQDPQYVWLEMFHQSVIPVRGVFDNSDELDGVGGRTPPNPEDGIEDGMWCGSSPQKH